MGKQFFGAQEYMGQFNRGDIIVHLVLFWRETISTE